ncbi:NAD(P)/FAD-dependent oxidoreductase [Marinospirillum sp. MEB164]|uniref:NAD(P)/FAD-dependent oxidoreductase n=1 Tax=Marinospirillum alkalitolerans TaxID=3123374 RepID=A0ABW8PXP5_9GAMM
MPSQSVSSSLTADVVVLGAGAAGLMCAATAGYQGARVLVIDHAKKPAGKVLMSGGGRCNFTNLNTTPAHYLSRNPHFCKSALKRYTPQDFVELVERHGVEYVEKNPGQLFCAESSKEIQRVLLTELEWSGAQLHLRTQLEAVQPRADGVLLHTSLGQIDAGALVIATGGLSIPTMGATGIGYTLARQFGLEVLPTRAGLVPLTLHPEHKHLFAPLSGLSCPVAIHAGGHTFTDDLLLTHRGLSGPAVLQVSNFWQEGQEVSINWLPDLCVSTALRQERQQAAKAGLAAWLGRHLPKRLAATLYEEITLHHDPLPARLADLSNERIDQLANHLQNWVFKPAGSEGYRTAEVTLGGVATEQISSQNFAVQGLEAVRFIGEVLDVTGQLGGFNFQWAWASAVACGRSF